VKSSDSKQANAPSATARPDPLKNSNDESVCSENTSKQNLQDLALKEHLYGSFWLSLLAVKHRALGEVIKLC